MKEYKKRNRNSEMKKELRAFTFSSNIRDKGDVKEIIKRNAINILTADITNRLSRKCPTRMGVEG